MAVFGMFRRLMVACGLAACLLLGRAAAAEVVGRDGTLQFSAGDSLPGRFVALPPGAGPRDTLLWQAPDFATPFAFPLDAIHGVRFPRPPARGRGPGWRILLHNGDVLDAVPEAIDADGVTAVLGAGADAQRVRIARAAVERLVRAAPHAAGGYVGPVGLAGWTQSPADAWSEEAGAIFSDVPGATVVRDVGGPPRAMYDMVIAWRRQPACRIAVAAGAEAGDTPYQLEVFAGAGPPQLLLVREEQDRAASEPLPEESVPAAAQAARRLRIVLFVDQEKGRFAVIVPEASPDPAGDVVLPPAAGRAASGRFRLVSGEHVALESLRVSTWVGERPMLDARTETVVVRQDGTRLGGAIAALEAGGGELVVRGVDGERRVPRDEVSEILFPTTGASVPRQPAVRVMTRDDGLLSGDLVGIDARGVRIGREGFAAPVTLPLEDVVALERRRAAAAVPPPPGRAGRLRHASFTLRGAVAGVEGAVGWQPLGSTVASRFAPRPETAFVVEYVERTGAENPAVDEVGGIGGMVGLDAEGIFVITMLRDDGAAALDGRVEAGDRILAVAPEKGSRFVETKGLQSETMTNLLRGRIGSSLRMRLTAGDGTNPREVELVRGSIGVRSAAILRQALDEHVRMAPGELEVAVDADYPALAFLRSGDVVPCVVEAIDEAGIRIRTPLAAAAQAVAVPAALVQAVELVPSAASRGIDRARLERLLTLPRMQRAQPPTHVVRLADGDYLRGRVVGLDPRALRMAVGDSVKDLPRDAVARVIWLHPEDLAERAAAEPPPADAGLMVQGVAAVGGRVTLMATGIDGGRIFGTSRALGAAELDIDAVDRLLLNAAIEAEAGSRPYGQWKLKPAAEPRALRKPEPAPDPAAG